MPGTPMSFPPSEGVFDARIYRGLDPGTARLARPAGPLGEPSAILVVGLTAAGDVLHFLPVAVALRRAFPRARLGWVVQEKGRAIVEGCPELDEIFVFERHRWQKGLLNPPAFPRTLGEIGRTIGGIRAGGYQVLFDPQGTAKSALVNLVAGAPRRVGFARGFCRELNHLTTNLNVILPTRRMHRVRKSLALLEAMGVSTDGADARYLVPEPAKAEADALLGRAGLGGKKFAVIHPGTSEFGARKRWPLERFGAVADRLHGDFGLVPAFVLGPIERAWREELLAGVRSAPRIALEPASLAELAGVMGRSALFLGCDSAPLHLASVLRIPSVGLYGPTDPVLFAPWYPPSAVVVKGLPCPSCGAPHCNHRVPRMEALGVEDAVAGVRMVLGLTESAPKTDNQ